MEDVPHAAGDDDAEDRFAALKHRHRNQLQTMTSLVGLFGRRLPAGECRNAFTDLRARFEALGFAASDESSPPDATISIDLAELADRLVRLLDPDRRHAVAITGGAVAMTERTAGAAAQIAAEMIIELFRRSLPREGRGTAELAVEALGQRLVIRVAADEFRADADGASELGWTLAESHARSCGGTLVRAEGSTFAAEASLPLAGLTR